MKSLVLKGIRDVVIEQVPEPIYKKGEAVIDIKSASVCGSDISAYLGRGMKIEYPRILGHEVAGIIREIDSSELLQIGDRVILIPYLHCGSCYPCSLGHTNSCESLSVLGVQIDGAISESFSHRTDLLLRLPDEINMTVAPVIEPLVIAIHSLKQAKAKEGEHVAIIGAGPIGVLTAMVALSYGCIPVILDVLDSRLEFVKQLGFQHTINPKRVDAVSEISRITKGRMAEVVVEMSGSNVGVSSTLEYASYSGRISLTGWPTGLSDLNTALITKKELVIKGSRTGTRNEFIEAIELVRSGTIDLTKIISKTVSIEELPFAMEQQATNPGEYLKVSVII